MGESGAGRESARAKGRRVDRLARREGYRAVGVILALLLALAAIGAVAGFRTRFFLFAELAAIALVLALGVRADANRRRGR
ncbi:MAG TPA: hypothetical protein VG366_02650 [Solirubrobacteraceae bacterium]|jgi:hypothetical protein|nr:hypothetical protein [Solirubrobacteraceae bacterium]